MILHYLGLDHIGHLEGPYSPLVAPKLLEMDSVIQRIYTALEKQVVFEPAFFFFFLIVYWQNFDKKMKF